MAESHFLFYFKDGYKWTLLHEEEIQHLCVDWASIDSISIHLFAVVHSVWILYQYYFLSMVGSMVVFYTMVMTLNNTKMSRNFLKLNSIKYLKNLLICMFVYCIVHNQFFFRIKKDSSHFIYPLFHIPYTYLLFYLFCIKLLQWKEKKKMDKMCSKQFVKVRWLLYNLI